MLDQLKAQKRWFCWKLETRPGQDKPTKVPYSAISGKKTGTDAKFSDTWTDYEAANKACAEHGYSGVDFKIPEDMFFLDIDHTTADDPRVSRIKGLLNTYAELSQSGAGVHFYGYIDSSRIPVEWNEKEHRNKLSSSDFDSLAERYESLKKRHSELETEINERKRRQGMLREYFKALSCQPELITEFDPMMFSILIDHATVYPDKGIVFTFRDGREV